MADKGLAPLSPHGPAQPIDHLRADMLAALDPADLELVWQPMVDFVSRAQAAGESKYTMDRHRSMLRRLLRCLYNREVRRSAGAVPAVDFDPTQQ